MATLFGHIFVGNRFQVNPEAKLNLTEQTGHNLLIVEVVSHELSLIEGKSQRGELEKETGPRLTSKFKWLFQLYVRQVNLFGRQDDCGACHC